MKQLDWSHTFHRIQWRNSKAEPIYSHCFRRELNCQVWDPQSLLRLQIVSYHKPPEATLPMLSEMVEALVGRVLVVSFNQILCVFRGERLKLSIFIINQPLESKLIVREREKNWFLVPYKILYLKLPSNYSLKHGSSSDWNHKNDYKNEKSAGLDEEICSFHVAECLLPPAVL